MTEWSDTISLDTHRIARFVRLLSILPRSPRNGRSRNPDIYKTDRSEPQRDWMQQPRPGEVTNAPRSMFSVCANVPGQLPTGGTGRRPARVLTSASATARARHDAHGRVRRAATTTTTFATHRPRNYRRGVQLPSGRLHCDATCSSAGPAVALQWGAVELQRSIGNCTGRHCHSNGAAHGSGGHSPATTTLFNYKATIASAADIAGRSRRQGAQ